MAHRKVWSGQARALAALVGVLCPVAFLAAQEKKTITPGTPVTITVQPAAPSTPPASLILGPRHGHVTPHRHGCTHTGGGNIDVAQPSPDTVVVTMTGVAVAYGCVNPASAQMEFDLEQAFEVSFDNPKLKKAKLTLEGRVIGLLRTHGSYDTAGYDNACAAVVPGPGLAVAVAPTGPDRWHPREAAASTVLHLCVPPHSVCGGHSLSVNDHDGPVSVPVVAGRYCLHQSFMVFAHAARTLCCKGPSAEFAPDPALDPLWISYKEPFHGAAKKDFGFQITLKVAEETEPAEPAKEEPVLGTGREKLPFPKEEKDK